MQREKILAIPTLFILVFILVMPMQRVVDRDLFLFNHWNLYSAMPSSIEEQTAWRVRAGDEIIEAYDLFTTDDTSSMQPTGRHFLVLSTEVSTPHAFLLEHLHELGYEGSPVIIESCLWRFDPDAAPTYIELTTCQPVLELTP